MIKKLLICSTMFIALTSEKCANPEEINETRTAIKETTINNKKMELKEYNDSISYAQGVDLAERFQQDGVTNLNSKNFNEAFNENFNNNIYKIDLNSAQQLVTKVMTELRDENGQIKADYKISQSTIDSTSTGLGVLVAENFKSLDMFKKDLKLDFFNKGFEDKSNNTPLLLDETKGREILQKYHMMIQTKMAEEQNASGSKTKQEGIDFLEKNKTKPGVKTTASGLQYLVIKEGTGKSPIATNTVKVHYHGTLINGKVFDSSVDRGETIEFPLNRVISGWTEGLQLMKEGGKTRFFIPYNLAYGERAAGASIQPFSTLIFDVELFEVK